MKLQYLTTAAVCLLAAMTVNAQAIWDKTHLEQVKENQHHPVYAKACEQIIRDAERQMDMQPPSVMMKNKVAASGDKHDYLSQARYFWPDPTKPDGLPYIQRDGESNPELKLLDRNRLSEMATGVTDLSLAWYLSRDAKYARKATELLRVWFLDKATHMNPNLTYAQMVPGRNGNKGRSFGVIDTYSFVEMLDAVRLLEDSPAFTDKDSRQLKAWFSKLLNWILTDSTGCQEMFAKNNHGTAYDVQVIAFADYVGNTKVRDQFVRDFKSRRIDTQIEADGSQPQELRRTLAFGYSQYNLTHMIDVLLMARHANIEVGGSTQESLAKVEKAIDFLLPYVGKPVSAWPYQQISDWEGKQREFVRDLYRAYLLDPSRTDYLRLYRQYATVGDGNRFDLLYVAADDQETLTSGWQFIRQDMANAWEVFRPASPGKPESVPLWQEVTLPHCFNAEDAVDPDVNYYEGAGWYRTVIPVANPYPGGRTLLQFEGAGQKTDVYVYINKVGAHVGGYDRWTVDITDAVNAFAQTEVCQKQFGGQVPIAIRCDNSRDVEMIPSDMSDFNLYGGLYRPVRLVYAPQTFVEDIQITTEGSTVSVVPQLNGADADGHVTVVITDPAGKEVFRRQTAAPIQTTVKKPLLWDVDSPNLYTCTVTVETGGQKSTMTKQFGFRTYEFREHGPFFLNGRRLLLQGTHRHEDHAGVGAAMTDEQILAEMKQIKEMGANFIRLAHYQQSERVLQLCDSLGFLVWEEIPWCRGGLGGEKYREQARRMLRNMIQQHCHHPSVILWGLGNENDWPGDFTTFEKDSIHAFMSELNAIAHQEDATRKTTIRRCDFCSDITDVYSPTIWAGWYGKSFLDYRTMEEAAMAKYPRFFHAEWGGDSHARRHAESDFKDMVQADKYGDWSETYMVRLFDWCLKEQQQMPNLTGAAFWTFKDFSTPLRPTNPVPYVNQKGVVERDGTLKETYFVFQSYWAKQPMLHIYGHSWPIRWGKAGEKKQVLVYSNCEEVELFVNGKSAGKRKRDITDYPAAGFHWEVELNEGENKLRAVSGSLSDEITQQYQTATWQQPTSIAVSQRTIAQDMVEIEVQLKDAQGVPCLDAANWISFELAGDGKLIANQGTSTGSRKVQAYNGRAIIRAQVNGRAVMAVKSPGVVTEIVEIHL